MPLLLPALDLATILTFAVVFVLALTIKVWLHAVFQVIDKVVGWVPFAGHWIKAGENHVLAALNVLVVKSRDGMSACISGLRWSLREFETGVRDFTDEVADHWQQLVAAALPTALGLLWGAVVARANGLEHRLDKVAGDIADSARSLKRYAVDQADAAEAAATRYADGAVSKVHDFVVDHVHGVYQEVEADIAAALRDAERYTDAAVGGLRGAEDAAIAAAAGAASAALAAAKSDLAGGIAAVSSSLATARRALDDEIAAATAGAAAAVNTARTAVEGELAAEAQRAAVALTSAAGTLTGQIAAAENAAETAAASALSAEAHTLEGAVADASAAAGAALNTAVATVEGELLTRARQAADALAATRATVESELGAAAQAAAAELHATASALGATVATVGQHVDAIAAQLQAAEAAAVGELTDIYNLPADALRDLLDRLDLTKVASFGAALVLTRALVNAITREAGLDSAECRAKTKQICGTPGGEWGDLLAGAAFVTGTLSLAELVVPAREAVHLLTDAIRQAA